MNRLAPALPLALAVLGLAACNPPEPAPYVEEDEEANAVIVVPETDTAPPDAPADTPDAAGETPTPTVPAEPAGEGQPGANVYGGEDEGAPAPPS